MKPKNPAAQPVSAEEFKAPDRSVYRFPYELFDKTAKYGRIMWSVEIIRRARKLQGSYLITNLYLWANSSEERYKDGRLFDIPCHTEAVGGCNAVPSGKSFTEHVWLAYYCADHGGLVMRAYPPNNTNTLVIDVTSGVSADLTFVQENPNGSKN